MANLGLRQAKKDSGAPSGPESSALVLPLAIEGGKIDGDG